MSTPPKSLHELSNNFSLFEEWEDRYRYLIDLGKQITPMDPGLKTDETLVRGCTSLVWISTDWKNDKLHLQADSNAQIIRGLIYILEVAYQHKSHEEIERTDVSMFFKELGLEQHLSPNRRNGFFSMVEKIKSLSPIAHSDQ